MQLLKPGRSDWHAAEAPLALGSIAWLDLDVGTVEVLRAYELILEAPWVNVMVRGHAAAVESFTSVVPYPEAIVPTPGPRPSADQARERLAEAPAPTASVTAQWLARRLGEPTIENLLMDLLETTPRGNGTRNGDEGPQPPGGVSRRGFYRRAEALRPLRPGDWRRLFSLTCQTRRCNTTVEHLASNLSVGARALRKRIEWLLGCRLADYRTNPGWMWLLESALRRHGYVGADRRDWPPRLYSPSHSNPPVGTRLR